MLQRQIMKRLRPLASEKVILTRSCSLLRDRNGSAVFVAVVVVIDDVSNFLIIV
jgi:hypothetical protein